MQQATTTNEIRTAIAAARRAGKSIGLVPTMGALHAGHLSLVDAARLECDFTVASVFVNPTQFAPQEDLAKYPRPLGKDMERLAAHGVDLVFVPTESEIYPPGHSTFVDVGPLGQVLEGQIRPTHFRGVATVVLKLFNIVAPDRAYFGQKDFQQSLVIKRMVSDLNVPVEIRVFPTVRELDGLAMSSRNAYLSREDRQRAIAISHSLRIAELLTKNGARDAASVLEQMRAALAAAGIDAIDYVVLADPNTLASVTTITSPTLAAIAARVGQTRLIDNALLLAQPSDLSPQPS